MIRSILVWINYHWMKCWMETMQLFIVILQLIWLLSISFNGERNCRIVICTLFCLIIAQNTKCGIISTFTIWTLEQMTRLTLMTEYSSVAINSLPFFWNTELKSESVLLDESVSISFQPMNRNGEETRSWWNNPMKWILLSWIVQHSIRSCRTEFHSSNSITPIHFLSSTIQFNRWMRIKESFHIERIKRKEQH